MEWPDATYTTIGENSNGEPRTKRKYSVFVVRFLKLDH